MVDRWRSGHSQPARRGRNDRAGLFGVEPDASLRRVADGRRGLRDVCDRACPVVFRDRLWTAPHRADDLGRIPGGHVPAVGGRGGAIADGPRDAGDRLPCRLPQAKPVHLDLLWVDAVSHGGARRSLGQGRDRTLQPRADAQGHCARRSNEHRPYRQLGSLDGDGQGHRRATR